MKEEYRRHFRLKECIDVTWKLADREISGEGLVVNISASGFLLQTDRVFSPSDNCVLSIGSGAESLPFAPKNGKIMWFRRIHTPEERIQCGVQFLPDDPDISFDQWLEIKMKM